jgi:hypothetical protein
MSIDMMKGKRVRTGVAVYLVVAIAAVIWYSLQQYEAGIDQATLASETTNIMVNGTLFAVLIMGVVLWLWSRLKKASGKIF